MSDLTCARRCLVLFALVGWAACSEPEPEPQAMPAVAEVAEAGALPSFLGRPIGFAAKGLLCPPGQQWTCYTAPFSTDGIGACERGVKTCAADGMSWGACVGEVTPTPETCGDRIDNDCDGTTDEDCGPTCVPTPEVCGDQADNDCDGNVDEGCECTPGEEWTCYSAPLETDGIGACQRGVKTCGGDGMGWGPCVGEITPVDEVCDDLVDNDCDGEVDEGCVPCVPVPEVCGDTLDNDCDGQVDDGCTYPLTVLRTGTGTGTVTSAPAGISCGATCAADFADGTTVTLTAAPAAGSRFVGWSGAGCTGTGTCTVAITAATTVTATFDLVFHELTVNRAGNGTGTVTSTPAGISCGATCAASFVDGTTVTLTATPGVGSSFTGWSGGGCTGTGTCTVTLTAATSVTATFTLQSFALTVTTAGNGTGTVISTPAGISCGATCTASYLYGTEVLLVATPAVGSTFTGWSGSGCTGTGTCTVSMTAARSVTATFTLNRYPLTVTRNGSGTGTVSSTPVGIDCGASCAASFDHGTTITLTAAADAGSRFDGWTGEGCTGTGTCTVALTAAASVTATFTRYHALTVTRAGSGSGHVASDLPGIDCGAACSADFDDGTVVTLTATTAPGSRFDGWSGAGCSGTGTCAVTMTAAASVTATFTRVHALTVTLAGSGSGVVASTPAGIDCGGTCAATYDDGTVVTLTAAPTGAGSRFAGWSGAGCTGTGVCTVTMTEARDVVATFIRRVTLTVEIVGEGTVTSDPAGIECGEDCTLEVDAPTTVGLVAAATGGMLFRSWSEAGCTTSDCSVVVDHDMTVTALFEYPTLTVEHEGTGFGEVTSVPDGIDCGADCDEDVPVGTVVTLTPDPQPGSRFDGWTGPCLNVIGGDDDPVVVGDSCRDGIDHDSDGIYGCADPDCASDTYCTTCGNGVLNTDETCDDGNRTRGDGCNASCKTELGFTCRFPGRACLPTMCEVAQVNGAGFLRNNYVELGLHTNGAFGSYTAQSPLGWHWRTNQLFRELGFVADPEGTNWTNYHGDFFTPGTPEEGWALAIGSNTYNNNRVGVLTQMAGELAPPECISNLCGARDGARVRWESSAPVGGMVDVQQDFTILDGGVFILIDVYLTNVTGTDLTNVYFMRNVDPDNDQSRHGNYTTTNQILAQPNATSDLAMVRATQNYFGAPPSAIALVASDPRARVTFGSFSVRDPRQVWNGTGGLSQSGSNVADVAISIAFRVDIPAGQTTAFRFAYNLESSAADVLTCVEHEDPNECVVEVNDDTLVTAHWTRDTRPLTVLKTGTGTGTVTSAPAGIDCGPTCGADFPKSSLVTLTAVADPGSRFVGWSGAGCSGIGTCTVAMTGARTVTAQFLRTVTLTVELEGEGYVSSWPPGIDCGENCTLDVAAGTGVDLYAEPAPGMAVARWEGAPGCAGTYCFVTVNDNMTVRVVFAPTVPLNVIRDGTGFGNVRAPSYGIECGSCGECGDICSADVALGAEVHLIARPDSGSRFDGWSGPCIDIIDYPGDFESGPYSECVVLVTAATDVTATFNSIYRLSVSTYGDGFGTVTSAPPGIECGFDDFDCDEDYLAGTEVTLTATPEPGSLFVGWETPFYETHSQTGFVPIPDNDPAGASLSVVVPTSSPATYLDVFIDIRHPDMRHLYVTLRRDGVDWAILWQNYWWYPYPDLVQNYNFYMGGDDVQGEWTLHAVDSVTGLSGNLRTLSLGVNGQRVSPTLDPIIMDTNRNVTAVFGERVVLDVALAGTGTGTVTSIPAGIACGPTCQAEFGSGAEVELIAQAAPGSTFTGWTGACTGMGPCFVEMFGSQSVVATFTSGSLLDVELVGTGSGTVTSDPAGITCTDFCSEIFDGVVTLTATADTGSEFAGWAGACTGTGPCVVTMTEARYVVAVFDVAGPPLTITFAGDGTGVVETIPGITCDEDCTHGYPLDSELTLIAHPNPDSLFTGWEGACTGTGPCTVTMDVARSVTATFELVRFPLTVARLGTGEGTVTSAPPGIDCGDDCTHDYVAGTEVTLTAATAPGSRFDGWGGACAEMAICTVSMFDPVDVEAYFVAVQTLTVATIGGGAVQGPGIDCGTECSATVDRGELVELFAIPDAGFAVGAWSDPSCSGPTCLVAMDTDRTITVTFVPTATLTVARAGTGTGLITSTPAGIDCGSFCSFAYPVGEVVTLTATPTGSSVFAGWSGACTGTGPCTVTLAASASVTATFTVAYRLTVSRLGNGSGTVTSSPPGIECGATCSGTFLPGTVVTLTATPTDGSLFTRWHDLSTSPTYVVTMNSNVSVAATFTADFTLAVTKAGSGSGTLYEASFDFTCGLTCSGFTGTHIGPGFAVHLTATPEPGTVFVGWEGACTGTGTCDVVMTGNTNITARFSRTHTLTIARAGTGSGRVVSTPTAIDCGTTCTATVLQDVPLTLTAIPEAGSVLVGWTPAQPGCSGATCALTVTSDLTLTATFAPAIPLTIEVVNGAGVGVVQSAPDLATCTGTCTREYAEGATVTLTALPAAGLASWSGACTGTGTCTVVMSEARTVTATFRPRHTLTVARIGAGAGTVTSAPAGITCGTTCSQTYFETETITLTAVPDGESAFLGWGGACTAQFGPCTVTIAGATTVTANFGAWVDPDLVAVPTLPPYEPDPNAQYDNEGRRILGTGAQVTISIDPTPSAGTALQVCAFTAVHCVRSGAGTLDECMFSMPRCTTEEPWNEATGCCAPTCWDSYRESRRLGIDPVDAFSHALFDVPSCMPGIDPQRGVDSTAPSSTFAEDMLTVHNQKRALHCVPPLEWNADLALAAQAYADVLLATRIWEHSPEARAGQHGENLEFDNNPLMLDVWRATLWYDEIVGYDWANPGNALPDYTDNEGQIGHFTQWVWKRNQSLGCGKATDGTTTYLVCKYGPGGNVFGDYERNVLPVCVP